MANALETEVTTEAQVASKTASLQLAIDQVANAVNLPLEINTAGADYTLTTNDIYRHGFINISGVTVAAKELTWPTGEARQILLFTDPANTQSIDITHGATTFALVPGAGFWIVSDGTTDDLKVFHIALLAAGGDYVVASGDTMTGDLVLDKNASGDTRYIEFATGLSARARFGTFGNNNIGLKVSADGASFVDAFIFNSTGQMSMAQGLTMASTASLTFSMNCDTTCAFQMRRYSTSNNTAEFDVGRARGTQASPADVVTSDLCRGDVGRAYVGGAMRAIWQQLLSIIETSPSTSALGGRIVRQLCPTGSSSLTEIAREQHATGLSAFGANVYLNPDRGIVARSTTISGVAALTKSTGTLYYISDYKGGVIAVYDGTNMVLPSVKELIVAVTDETTAITAGASKVKVKAPCAMKLNSAAIPRAFLSTPQTGSGGGGIFTVDIHEGATTILSTKLTFDNGEDTTTTAATAAVISDTSIADDATLHFDVDQIGDGTAKGLKVCIYYREIVA